MFNDRLKEARGKSDKTQDEVADYLNIKRQTYSAYERGVSTPDPETIGKLADYFSVSTDYLLGLTDDPRPAGETGPLPDILSGLSEEDKQEILHLIEYKRLNRTHN